MSDANKEVSKEFWDAIINGGTGVINCGFCDRVHFVSTDDGGWTWTWGDGELGELLKNQKKDPDKYILHSGDDSVSYGHISGITLVYGCPCDAAKKYENLFWENRQLIADYFEARAKKMTAQAEKITGLALRVKSSV